MNDILADIYSGQLELLKMHLADFSEADMLVRPAEGANHAAWHLGHLSTSEAQLINVATPGAIPTRDASFTERHSTKGAKLNEGFASKNELMRAFEETREK